MAFTKLLIFNQALGYLGCGSIETDTEMTEEARACSMFWDLARQTTLRDFPFSFAQKRASLAEIELDSEYTEYKYAYSLPNDLVKSNKIISGTHIYNLSDYDIDTYRIVQNASNQTQTLLCSVSPCVLEYTADTGDKVSFADASFVEMVGYKLASLICIPLLKNNSSKLQEVNQIYGAKLAIAWQNDATSRKKKKSPDTWIMALKGGVYDRNEFI